MQPDFQPELKFIQKPDTLCFFPMLYFSCLVKMKGKTFPFRILVLSSGLILAFALNLQFLLLLLP